MIDLTLFYFIFSFFFILDLSKRYNVIEVWYLLQGGHICHRSHNHVTEEKDIEDSEIGDVIQSCYDSKTLELINE